MSAPISPLGMVTTSDGTKVIPGAASSSLLADPVISGASCVDVVNGDSTEPIMPIPSSKPCSSYPIHVASIGC